MNKPRIHGMSVTTKKDLLRAKGNTILSNIIRDNMVDKIINLCLNLFLDKTKEENYVIPYGETMFLIVCDRNIFMSSNKIGRYMYKTRFVYINDDITKEASKFKGEDYNNYVFNSLMNKIKKYFDNFFRNDNIFNIREFRYFIFNMLTISVLNSLPLDIPLDADDFNKLFDGNHLLRLIEYEQQKEGGDIIKIVLNLKGFKLELFNVLLKDITVLNSSTVEDMMALNRSMNKDITEINRSIIKDILEPNSSMFNNKFKSYSCSQLKLQNPNNIYIGTTCQTDDTSYPYLLMILEEIKINPFSEKMQKYILTRIDYYKKSPLLDKFIKIHTDTRGRFLYLLNIDLLKNALFNTTPKKLSELYNTDAIQLGEHFETTSLESKEIIRKHLSTREDFSNEGELVLWKFSKTSEPLFHKNIMIDTYFSFSQFIEVTPNPSLIIKQSEIFSPEVVFKIKIPLNKQDVLNSVIFLPDFLETKKLVLNIDGERFSYPDQEKIALIIPDAIFKIVKKEYKLFDMKLNEHDKYKLEEPTKKTVIFLNELHTIKIQKLLITIELVPELCIKRLQVPVFNATLLRNVIERPVNEVAKLMEQKSNVKEKLEMELAKLSMEEIKKKCQDKIIEIKSKEIVIKNKLTYTEGKLNAITNAIELNNRRSRMIQETDDINVLNRCYIDLEINNYTLDMIIDRYEIETEEQIELQSIQSVKPVGLTLKQTKINPGTEPGTNNILRDIKIKRVRNNEYRGPPTSEELLLDLLPPDKLNIRSFKDDVVSDTLDNSTKLVILMKKELDRFRKNLDYLAPIEQKESIKDYIPFSVITKDITVDFNLLYKYFADLYILCNGQSINIPYKSNHVRTILFDIFELFREVLEPSNNALDQINIFEIFVETMSLFYMAISNNGKLHSKFLFSNREIIGYYENNMNDISNGKLSEVNKYIWTQLLNNNGKYISIPSNAIFTLMNKYYNKEITIVRNTPDNKITGIKDKELLEAFTENALHNFVRIIFTLCTITKKFNKLLSGDTSILGSGPTEYDRLNPVYIYEEDIIYENLKEEIEKVELNKNAKPLTENELKFFNDWNRIPIYLLDTFPINETIDITDLKLENNLITYTKFLLTDSYGIKLNRQILGGYNYVDSLLFKFDTANELSRCISIGKHLDTKRDLISNSSITRLRELLTDTPDYLNTDFIKSKIIELEKEYNKLTTKYYDGSKKTSDEMEEIENRFIEIKGELPSSKGKFTEERTRQSGFFNPVEGGKSSKINIYMIIIVFIIIVIILIIYCVYKVINTQYDYGSNKY